MNAPVCKQGVRFCKQGASVCKQGDREEDAA